MDNFTEANKYYSAEFAMPLNAAYIPTASTTAISMAQKLNFSNTKTEEIRNAVSETVSFLINNSRVKDSDSQFRIKFTNNNDELKVEINSSVKFSNENVSSASFNLIKGCMDNVNLIYDNESVVGINMIKKNN